MSDTLFDISIPEIANISELQLMQVDGFIDPTGSVIIDPDVAVAVIGILKNYSTISFDTETTGLDWTRCQLHGVSIGTNDHEWYFCGDALLAIMPGLRELADSDILWVGHNVIFDLHFLAPYGIRPRRIADTMIGQWLVDENQEIGLKSLAFNKLGYAEPLLEFRDLQKEVKAQKGHKKAGDVLIWEFPLDKLGKYAALDARLTYDLWLLTIDEMTAEEVTDDFWNYEMPFMYVLLDMESNGIYIDQRKLSEVKAIVNTAGSSAFEEWNKLSGGINPNSPKQLAEFLFETLKLPSQDVTASGNQKTDALVLQRLVKKDKTGAIAALLEYKKYSKLMSTYITMLEEQPVNGRIYGSFNQTGARTGRLSSSGPNLQNIPSHGELGAEMRKIFAAPKGYKIVVADYSQIELRLLAHDSQDRHMMQVFIDKGDPHQMTADRANVERFVGKKINFSWAYGAGPKSLCDGIEKEGNPRPSLKEAKEWLESFDAAYPDLVRYKTQTINTARMRGYLTTMLGRKRRLPELNSFDNGLRAGAERQTINSRIQGSAADVLKYAMIEIHKQLPWYGARMVAQVHDELVFEVPEALADSFKDVVQNIMESIKDRFELSVPIEAAPNVGDNWYEAK